MDHTVSPHSVAETLTARSAAGFGTQLPHSIAVRLGDHLVAESWITPAQFQECLRTADSQRLPLTDVLIALFKIPETNAYEALSVASGIPLIDLEATPISRLAVRLIPERITRRCAAIAFAEDNGTITFASSQPFSTEIHQEMSFVSGRHPEQVLARPSQIAAALDRFYPPGHVSDNAVETPARTVHTVTQPSQASADDVDPRTLPPGSSLRKRILVADDDRLLRLLVRTLLEREGYDVREAQDGREAADAVLEHAPDLLIADLVMPHGDGFETVASLRSEGSGRNLPVIVLTAEPAEIARKTVLFLGADDYVTKPFDADALLSRVRAVFVRRLQL